MKQEEQIVKSFALKDKCHCVLKLNTNLKSNKFTVTLKHSLNNFCKADYAFITHSLLNNFGI